MIEFVPPRFRLVDGLTGRFPRYAALMSAFRKVAGSFSSRCYVVTSPYGTLLFDGENPAPLLMARVRTQHTALWMLNEKRYYEPEPVSAVEDNGLLQWLHNKSLSGGIETQEPCLVHTSGAVLSVPCRLDIRPWESVNPGNDLLRRIFPTVFAGAGWRTLWKGHSCFQEFSYNGIDFLAYIPSASLRLPRPPAGCQIPYEVRFAEGEPIAKIVKEYGKPIRLGLVRYDVSRYGIPCRIDSDRLLVLFPHLDGGIGDVVQRDGSSELSSHDVEYLLRHWRIDPHGLEDSFKNISQQLSRSVLEIYYCIESTVSNYVIASIPKGGVIMYLTYLPPSLQLCGLFARLKDDTVVPLFHFGDGLWMLTQASTAQSG